MWSPHEGTNRIQIQEYDVVDMPVNRPLKANKVNFAESCDI